MYHPIYEGHLEELAEITGAAEKDEVITLNINSPGGSFFEGLAIYNHLKSLKNKVVVNNIGVAASIAAVIAMAGDEINSMEQSFWMFHRAWTVAIGNSKELSNLSELLRVYDAAAFSIASQRIGIPLAKFEKMIDDSPDGELWIEGENMKIKNEATEIPEKNQVKQSIEAKAPVFEIEEKAETKTEASDEIKAERERVSTILLAAGVQANVSDAIAEGMSVLEYLTKNARPQKAEAVAHVPGQSTPAAKSPQDQLNSRATEIVDSVMNKRSK